MFLAIWMCLVTHTGQRHEQPKAKQLSPVDSVQTRHSHRHKRSIMHIKIAMQWNAIGTRYGLKTNINVSSPFVVVVVVVIWLNCTEMGKHSPGRATHSHIIFIAISCGQLLHFSHTHTHLTQTRTDNRHTPRRIDGIFHVFFLSFVCAYFFYLPRVFVFCRLLSWRCSEVDDDRPTPATMLQVKADIAIDGFSIPVLFQYRPRYTVRRRTLKNSIFYSYFFFYYYYFFVVRCVQ